MENIIKIESKKSKSRAIGIYQYFEILQLEWICSDLRLKIYRRPSDKSHYKKVCEGKRKTIENIAEKNNLPTIFNDSDFYESLRSRIVRNISYPEFIYKDQDHRQNQEYWDLFYYYHKGVEVRFDLFGESKVGVIKSYKSLSSNITVQVKGETKEVILTVDKVTRIL